MARGLKQPTLNSEVHRAWQTLTTQHTEHQLQIEEAIARFVIYVRYQIEQFGIASFSENQGLICTLVEASCKELPSEEVAHDADRIIRKIQRELSTGRLQWGQVEHPKYKALPEGYVETIEALMSRLQDDPTFLGPDFARFVASTAAGFAADSAARDQATSKLFAEAAGHAEDHATMAMIISRVTNIVEKAEANVTDLLKMLTEEIGELEQLMTELDDRALVNYREVIARLATIMSRHLDAALEGIRNGTINQDLETFQAFQQRLDAITTRITSASITIN